MSPLILALAWPTIQGTSDLAFTLRSVEVREDGIACVQVALRNRSHHRLRAYPPFHRKTVNDTWTLPPNIGPSSIVIASCPSFAYYEERDMEPDEVFLETCEVRAPKTEPAKASYRATLSIDYSSVAPSYCHVSDGWPGAPPSSAQMRGGRIWVDVCDGRIVQAGIVEKLR